jgi:hypothetical protein
MINSEKGIAQVLVLVLLVAGIAIGGYLVQQRTNLLPQAADSVGDTGEKCTPTAIKEDDNCTKRKGAQYYCDSTTKTCQFKKCPGSYSCPSGSTCQSNGTCVKGTSTTTSNSTQSSTSQSSTSTTTNKTTSGSTTQSGTDSKECRNNPVNPPLAGYTWVAACGEAECRSNDDCPANLIDTNFVKAETSHWCYKFSNGSRCMQLRRTEATYDDGTPIGAGDYEDRNNPNACYVSEGSPTTIKFEYLGLGQSEVYRENQSTTYLSCQETFTRQAKRADKKLNDLTDRLNTNTTLKDPVSDSTKAIVEKTKQLVETANKAAEACVSKATAQCAIDATNATQLADIQYHLAKYNEIINGAKDRCVKADLGVTPMLAAGGIAHPNDELRLLLCTGDDGKTKWRVSTLSGAEERLAGLFPNIVKEWQNAPADQKAAILEKTGASPTWGLKIEYDGGVIELTEQDSSTVQQILKPWVDAAKAGKTTIQGGSSSSTTQYSRDNPPPITP